MLILVVDDDRSIRALLERFLTGWGHKVLLAADGEEAWKILQSTDVRFVLSDWTMPHLNGVELCRRIRAQNQLKYIYIILLTAHDTKRELVIGMEAGADDFMVKPFDRNELKVRIRAGERILKLEKDLANRNRKLNRAYKSMRKDLEAAARMQVELLPKAGECLCGFLFDWIFIPCSVVAGDTFNYFSLDDRHVAFHVIDVAGHGIPAAMLSFTLSKTLAPAAVPGNPLRSASGDSNGYCIARPAEVAAELNRHFLSGQDAMQYFTMIYGVIDHERSEVSFVQAGHPPLVYMPHEKPARIIGKGGFPIGMLSTAKYEENRLRLFQGDRMILYSDGITECRNGAGEQFSERRLLEFLERYSRHSLREMMTAIENSLRTWRGEVNFEDDITLLAVEAV